MRSPDEVVELFRERRDAHGPILAKCRELTDAYQGDLAVPLPEMDRDEKVAVANLLAQGLDQFAGRISSTMPDVQFPPERPGIKASENNADIRRRATLGWWDTSKLDILMGRRARHLLGYASTPVAVRWNPRLGVPTWTLPPPLSTFPAPTVNPDDCEVDDCIVGYRRTLGWLNRNYPQAAAILEKGDAPNVDTTFDVLEYADAEQISLIVVGQTRSPNRNPIVHDQGPPPGAPLAVLEDVPNRAGVCPFVVPGRITLGRRQGKFDGLIGLFEQQAKLMALEVIAVTEGVWPKTWLVARPNEIPDVVIEARPKEGITGMVKGGELITTQLQPGYKTTDTIDRLERAQRGEGGIMAEMSGESATNIRTGRRGESVMSATVDMPVQESQRVLERSLQTEVRVAMATAKAYGGNAPKSFYVNWKGAKGRVDYTPNKNFTDFTNFVSFPYAGADINQLMVGVGQRMSLKTMSRQTARRLDPMIDDPSFEDEQVTAESLGEALLASVQQDVAKGAYTAVEVARMMTLLEEDAGRTLAEVVTVVHNEHQARQAGQDQAGGPPGAGGPGQPPSPDQQPGLAPPASGGPGGAGQPGQPGPGGPGGITTPPNVAGLAQLLGSLRAPMAAAGNGAGPPGQG